MLFITILIAWLVFCYFRALLISETTTFNLDRANAELDLQHQQWRWFGYNSFRNMVQYRKQIKTIWPNPRTRPEYYHLYF